MSSIIAIIDYDMGNLKSVAKAFEAVGADVRITRDPKLLQEAERIVLPGVGAFTECMANLKHYKLIEPIKKQIQMGKPFLGICLGLQLLFDESNEFGPTPGLGLLKGVVKKFAFPENSALKIPHMGWNEAAPTGSATLFKDLPTDANFYFVHSFYAVPDDEGMIATKTNYGVDFCSSIESQNLFACQFHPEKSQKNGLQVLRNFLSVKA